MLKQISQIITKSINRVQDIRSQKNEGWKFIKKGQHLTISSKQYQEYQSQLYKIEGTIPSKPENICSYYFENHEALKKNRDQCIGIDILDVVDQETLITAFKLKPINNGQIRETLSVRHKVTLAPHEFLVVNGHLDEHPKLSRKEDIIRSEVIVNAQYLTRIDSNNTHLEIYFLNNEKLLSLIKQFQYCQIYFQQIMKRMLIQYYLRIDRIWNNKNIIKLEIIRYQ